MSPTKQPTLLAQDEDTPTVIRNLPLETDEGVDKTCWPLCAHWNMKTRYTSATVSLIIYGTSRILFHAFDCYRYVSDTFKADNIRS